MSAISEIMAGKSIRRVIENHCVTESAGPSFTVEQLMNVYDGTLEVHNSKGELLYTIPLPDEAVDKALISKVSVTLTRPIKKLERYADALVAYI